MSGRPYSEQKDLHAVAPYRSALLSYPANFAQALKDAQADKGKTLIGVAHGIPSTFVTKLLASAKPDFIWIDQEHAMFNRLELHDAIHAAQFHSEGRAMVVVRVPKNDETSLVTALDAGAAGIVIPHVESVADVQEKIEQMYYPPRGKRSFSPWIFTPGVSDASLYPDDQFNIRTANDHVVVIPQIESVKGVENADEIAAMPGIGGLMFGPGDYMIDAQLPLKLGGEPHPTFLAAITKFSQAAHKNNVPIFGAAQTIDQVPMLLDAGYAGIAVAFDVWGLASLAATSVKKAREIVKERFNPETATDAP